MPDTDHPVSLDNLRRNLFDRYVFRSYADPGVVMDDVDRNNGRNYLSAFLRLAMIYDAAGDSSMARQTFDRMLTVMPPDRLRPLPPQLDSAIARFGK